MTHAEYEREQAAKLREILDVPAVVTPVKKSIRFRARVPANLGKGGKRRDAIVTIDKALTIRIRPFRGRKTYEMSMEQAVGWLMQKLVVPEKIGKPRRRRSTL